MITFRNSKLPFLVISQTQRRYYHLSWFVVKIHILKEDVKEQSTNSLRCKNLNLNLLEENNIIQTYWSLLTTQNVQFPWNEIPIYYFSFLLKVDCVFLCSGNCNKHFFKIAANIYHILCYNQLKWAGKQYWDIIHT